MIAIEITKMPEKCDGCSFEDRFGGCVLLNCIGNDYPVEEFDEEWRNARKEGRRLKYCPLKQECELLAVMKTEKDHYAASDTEKLNFDFKSKEGFAFQNYMDMLMGEERGIVNPDDYCEHEKRGKNEQKIHRRG